MLHAPATARTHRLGDAGLDRAVEEFATARRRLLGIAYRMMGNWSEAEDIVQETWLRWQLCDRDRVLNPTAYLVTTTTRLAINASQTARARRESYVGHWIIEPIDAADPATDAERDDALQDGIALLLQQLAPKERAAYVLRQAFDYPYARIAQILQLTEVNVRQLVSRAGRCLASNRHRPTDRDEHRRVVQSFVAASRHGDVDTLERVLVGSRGAA